MGTTPGSGSDRDRTQDPIRPPDGGGGALARIALRLHRLGRALVSRRLRLRGDRGRRRRRRRRSPTAPRRCAVSQAFGDGFWSLIPFTMQMAFVAIGGYVVATSPPAQRLIHRLALIPSTGRGAVGFVGAVSMLASLLNWGLSLIFGGLLVRALARRTDLRMDYRAAAAAAYLGLGATWAMGLSLVRRAAAGQRCEPAPAAAADHRRDPVHRDDLPLAVDGHHRPC